MPEEFIRVTVVSALPHEAGMRTVLLPAGATVGDALVGSGLGPVPGGGTAVFGARVQQAEVLRDGDRVEVLRPLQVDPKEARRKRAGSRPARRR